MGEGPKILFTIPVLGGIDITETIRNTWVIMLVLVLGSIWFTRGLKTKNPSKRQMFIEMVYKTFRNFLAQTMGEDKVKYLPYMASLFMLSMFSSLSSLTGAFPPTADYSMCLAFALVTFVWTIGIKIKKNGVLGYFKDFFSPVFFIAPINIVGELATPISMSFRHFGNIASGGIITSLIYMGLAALTQMIFNVGIPFLQVGIPAVLSLYFDVFASFMQAFIITMLTMIYVSMALDD